MWGEHLSEEGDCHSGHTKPCVSTPTFRHFPQIILTYSRVNALKQACCLLSQIKFYWTQPGPFVYISVAVFALQWKSEIAAIKTVVPAKPVSTIWLFTHKKMC